MGSCGMDYLAQVAAWPKPDQKLRTECLEASFTTGIAGRRAELLCTRSSSLACTALALGTVCQRQVCLQAS